MNDLDKAIQEDKKLHPEWYKNLARAKKLGFKSDYRPESTYSDLRDQVDEDDRVFMLKRRLEKCD